MDASLRDWAELPIHIVDVLVIKLDQFSDYVRFCGVCPKWRNAALEANVVHKMNLDILKSSRRKLPMLVFQTEKKCNERRIVYNVANKARFGVKLPFSSKYIFVGSSRGWLFCLELGRNINVTLVNPINGGCISLPVFDDPINESWRKRIIYQYFIKKGILLIDPDASPNRFMVVVIYGDMYKLAFFRSGDPSWTFINSEGHVFVDIIHNKGTLYGVNRFGKLVEVDIPGKTIKTIVPGTTYADQTYLVESQDGELLMIKRKWFPWYDDGDDGGDVEAEAAGNEDDDNNHVIDTDSYDSEGEFKLDITCLDDDGFPLSYDFKIFKMTHPIEEGLASWVKVKNLGQQALFVGDSQSVSVSTTDSPGCIPNSISYLNGHHHAYGQYMYRGLNNEDSGVFKLEDESTYLYPVLGSSEKCVHPPIWFVPNPQEINFE